MLSFSFIIPAYNAGRHLERCLRSIRQQEYPQEKIEVVVLDGGSADSTREIARRYGCRVMDNKKRLAEYGVQLGVLNASGELLVVFAADNELIGSDWVKKVAELFERDAGLCAVWGRLASGPGDAALNRYFALIQSDPLNWFLNSNLRRYEALAQRLPEKAFEFKVEPARPLVWGANGLVYRAALVRNIWQQEGYLGDNDAFQYMVEQGNGKVVYFERPFVYHHHVARLGDWIGKWRRNFLHHLLEKRQTRNMNWAFTPGFGGKAALWFFYSLIPVFSFCHSAYLACRERNRYWFYHPVVSFLQALTYVLLVAGHPQGRRLVMDLLSNKKKGLSYA